MDNVIAFTPRQHPPEPEALAPLAGLALRAHLEGAAQTALDAADRIIAALDRIEGADDTETAPDPRPAMAARAGRVIRLREPAAPIIATPEPETPPEAPQAEPEPEPVAVPEIRTVFPPLPWGGAGNVVAAAGCAVLALVGMRA